ncbi:MAG TPA: class E sortase [Candidatus Dormibacteraeota bacterium]|jgi:sortase A
MAHTSARGRVSLRVALMSLGLVAILVGAGLIAVPLLGVWQRGNADQTALSTWQKGGSNALTGAPSSATAVPRTAACGSGSPSDYALVSFSSPAAEHYGGVATDGNWDSLHDRSMVHYTGTPAPGQPGNSIIAFHREPEYEHIDQLNVGDTVSVQDRTCHTFTYKVTGKWTLDPTKVTQLVPTSGHDLTLVTCTPFWVDSLRIIWRATLVSPST